MVKPPHLQEGKGLSVIDRVAEFAGNSAGEEVEEEEQPELLYSFT